ncbi:unnamed protein product [Rangifer tarandus platyrhynchus]|uniref:Uncharacterized protein n=1 Tax=Rangifer tarandus platyrhynchus TaxID=3082113 RepID=A0ABN8ZQ81_RANTA|nr:unnamed protein product [Rangifer tarandus platyrhynchus]
MWANRHKDDASLSKAAPQHLAVRRGGNTCCRVPGASAGEDEVGPVEPRRALPVTMGWPASRTDGRVASHPWMRQPPLAVGPPLQSGPTRRLAGVLRGSC